MESDDFTRHYIIKYLSAHELVLPCIRSALFPGPAQLLWLSIRGEPGNEARGMPYTTLFLDRALYMDQPFPVFHSLPLSELLHN